MTKKTALTSLIIMLASASLVVGGGVAIYFGVQNISGIYQLVYSPLDRLASSNPQDNGNFLPPQQAAENFIPVLTVPDSSQGEQLAPEITDPVTSSGDDSGSQQAPVEPVPQQVPERVVIKKLGVDAIVVPVTERTVDYLGEQYSQWKAPATGALGWHNTSALLGGSGNTVINGHSSGVGDTFKNLADLANGDIIDVYAGDFRYSYAVANVMILKERWEPIEVRLQNALWINPSSDERLTLISCWPNNSSTHRLIVVAVPLNAERVKQATAEGSTFVYIH